MIVSQLSKRVQKKTLEVIKKIKQWLSLNGTAILSIFHNGHSYFYSFTGEKVLKIFSFALTTKVTEIIDLVTVHKYMDITVMATVNIIVP